VKLVPDDYTALVKAALAEDVGRGDLTTGALVPPETAASFVVLAKGNGVIAGLPVFAAVFAQLSREVKVEPLAADGDAVAPGARVARLSGPAAPILAGERTALNFLQRLSGVATLTRRFVDAVAGTGARILDTRKTTPGWRALEKYAVVCGGGVNHRMGLYDACLIKDNHLRLLGISPAAAVRRAREALSPGTSITCEVETAADAAAAAEAGADVVLLDNMSPAQLAAAVVAVKKAAARGGRRVETEASGGVTLDNVEAVAASGVDRISVGALTHSAPALDVSMEVE